MFLSKTVDKKRDLRTFCRWSNLSRFTRFRGGQSDHKFAVGGPQLILRAGSEVIDLSLLSKIVPSNIEESQAVDLSLRPSKAPCPVSLKEVTLEESSVCPVKSQREGKLLDILRLAGRRRRDQGMLCHLCDLEVSFYTFTTVKYLSHVCYCSLIQHKVALHMPEVDTELHQTCLCADSSTIISD